MTDTQRKDFAQQVKNARTQAKINGDRVKKYRVRSVVGFVIEDKNGNETQAFLGYRD